MVEGEAGVVVGDGTGAAVGDGGGGADGSGGGTPPPTDGLLLFGSHHMSSQHDVTNKQQHTREAVSILGWKTEQPASAVQRSAATK